MKRGLISLTLAMVSYATVWAVPTPESNRTGKASAFVYVLNPVNYSPYDDRFEYTPQEDYANYVAQFIGQPQEYIPRGPHAEAVAAQIRKYLSNKSMSKFSKLHCT